MASGEGSRVVLPSEPKPADDWPPGMNIALKQSDRQNSAIEGCAHVRPRRRGDAETFRGHLGQASLPESRVNNKTAACWCPPGPLSPLNTRRTAHRRGDPSRIDVRRGAEEVVLKPISRRANPADLATRAILDRGPPRDQHGTATWWCRKYWPAGTAKPCAPKECALHPKRRKRPEL